MATHISSHYTFRQELTVVLATEKSLTVTLRNLDISELEDPVAQGWVKVYDVEPQDLVNHTVSSKVYQDTGNTILQTCTSSDYAIDVYVRSSSPLVEIDSVQYELFEVADGGHYEGPVSIILDSGAASLIYTFEVTGISPDGDTGPVDTITVTVDTPPTILTLSFTGGYPGTQTELKAGDTFQITGTTDKDADAIDIQDSGAFDASLEVIAAGTTFTVTGTVADRGTTTQNLPATVRARDASTGGFGSTRATNTAGGSVDGTDLIALNNFYPTASFGAITYPGAQTALKGTETAQVAVTTANYDVLVYSQLIGELSVDVETPTQVDVSRAGGTYNDSVNNLQVTAIRSANGASTSDTTVVFIANTSPTITVAEPYARLRSGGNDGTSIQSYTITLTSDQNLSVAPTLNEDVGGGTFIGSWAGGPKVWTRTIQIHDDDVKGTYNYQGLVATNGAGNITNLITGDDSYELGGFVARDLTFPAFSQTTPLNVEVIDYTKLQAGIFTATSNAAQRNASQGDHSDIVDTYTVDALATNPTTIWWNDIAAAGSHSTGTAKITSVEETV